MKIPHIAKIKIEDKNEVSCIIYLPKRISEIDKFDDSFDELISNQIEEKIFFNELGYTILEIKEMV